MSRRPPESGLREGGARDLDHGYPDPDGPPGPPVYGLLTLWAVFHQPDPGADFEAYAGYASSGVYLATHLVGSIFGIVLAIFGAFALGVSLASGRAGGMALVVMVAGVAGNRGLLYSASTVLFGVAVWRLRTLSRWAGALYAPTGFLISILGLMIGASQTVGSALPIAGTAWISHIVLRGFPTRRPDGRYPVTAARG